MIVKLLTEQHLEFLGGYRGSFEFTLVKMPYCWKSHALAQLCKDVSSQITFICFYCNLVISNISENKTLTHFLC